jgi:2-polyprenyl-3-methyl-5-hydroxy-6-metoxy-1,4-benzoquinol methylase
MDDKFDPKVLKYSKGTKPGGTNSVIVGACPTGTEVLDVGCASGYLGEELQRLGCKIWGVDSDKFALDNIAAGTYEETLELDLNQISDTGPFFPHLFDVVIAADVLEHLLEPERVLRSLAKSLKPNGLVIVSLPNVANFSIRTSLLFGRFDYTEVGILDRTHLHLYTYKSAAQLVTDSGLRIVSTFAGSDRFGTMLNRSAMLRSALAPLLAFNIILVCQAPQS